MTAPMCETWTARDLQRPRDDRTRPRLHGRLRQCAQAFTQLVPLYRYLIILISKIYPFFYKVFEYTNF